MSGARVTRGGPFKTLSANFIKAVERQGLEWRHASPIEKKEDIDFVVWRVAKGKASDIWAISLKKTVVRKAKKRKEVWGWVEFHDKYGNPGWLFKKTTFVAFQRKNDFVLLAKTDFKRWIDSGIIHWGRRAKSAWEARYRIFRRPKTRENIAQFKLADGVRHCRHYKWLFNERDS